MAAITKFYPCGSTAPYEPATWRGSWTSHASTGARTLSDDKTGERVGPFSHSGAASSNSLGILRFVSNPLEAQTISGTLDMAINVQESNADANFFTKVYLYVTQGDSDTPRGTLLNFSDTGGTEWLTTSFGKVYGLSSAQALSSLAVSAGDRLVLEFGAIAVAGSGSSRTATAWFGATNRNFDGSILTDAVVNDTGTGITSAGFFTFSNAVNVQRPDAADGDLIAGNGSLYLYDGTTGALKRRVIAVGSSDPAGAAQIELDGTLYVSYESLNVGDDPENGQIALYDPVTLAYQSLFQTVPGIGPHSLDPDGDGGLLAGFVGDGIAATSCGEGTVFDATYPKTTGTTNTDGATYPSRTIAPPSTVTYSLVSSAAFDRDYVMTVTVAETFTGGGQPTFAVGKTGATTLYYGTGTFTNQLAGAVFTNSGTIAAGADIIITEVESATANTGSLTVSVTYVSPQAQTLIASSGAGDREVQITVDVAETFANGNGLQPEFQVGVTGDTDLFAASSVFTGQASGAQFTYSGTLLSGKALLVTAQRAVGTTSTGSLQVQATAIGVSTSAAMAVRQYSDTGTLATTYAVAPDLGGSNAIDLNTDKLTLLYTSLGRKVKAYDIVGDAQLPDFATLPPATNGEIARGIRILPDATVLVADAVDVKRLDTDGNIIQTYSIADQVDWGTLALSPDGTEFWVANRADGAVSAPMIAKFDVASGDLLVSITENDVSLPDTGGGMCSGGITVINGFRASLAECVIPAITVQPLSQTINPADTVTLTVTVTGTGPFTYQWYLGEAGDESHPIVGETSDTYTNAEIVNDTSFWVQVTNACSSADSATALITVEMPTPARVSTMIDPIRWVRRTPTIFSDGKRVFHRRLQVDMQVGVGLSVAADEHDHDPIILQRQSDDNGMTWSSFREMTMGAQGNYLKIARLFQLGAAYNRVYELSGDSPVKFCLVQAFLDIEGGDH